MTHQSAEELHASIQNDVRAITPLDEIEGTHVRDILAWTSDTTDIFRVKKPDIPPKHLVSYFVVVDPTRRSMLLVDHIKAQLWLPTGGHVEPREHPKTTVIREVKEELGKSLPFLHGNDKPFFATVTKTVGLTAGHTDVSLWYLLRGHQHEFINYDRREFNDIEWFSFDDVLQSDPVIFDPHLQRFTQKLARYIEDRGGYPA